MTARCARALREDAIPELSRLTQRLGVASSAPELGTLREVVADGLSIIGAEIEGLRHLIHALRPSSLDQWTLVPSLAALAGQFAAREGLDVRCRSIPADVEPLVSAEESLAVYRIVEEAMRNAAEHADASRVDVVLDTRGGVRLTVDDDGRGFELATVRPGFGLATMRERAQIIDAVVRLETSPGDGTSLSITLPRPRTGAETSATNVEDPVDPEIDARLDRLRRGVEAQEAECAYLAREIHDDPVQHLASILAHVRWRDIADDAALLAAADRMRNSVDYARRSLAALADGLAPSPLGGIGLSRALARLAEQLSRDGLEVALDITPQARLATGSDDELSVYRIVQEALANAAKHGQATHARISLRQAAGKLIVIISDDGIGFDVTATRRGHGLTSIGERATMLGGKLALTSSEQAGTTLRLSVPSHDVG